MNTEPTRPQSKRRWFQYSLRTLLILTAIIAVLLGWWSRKARQQCAAVAAVKAMGGIVQYNYEEKDLKLPALWPNWLVDLLGVDYFANVTTVALNHTHVTDAGMEHLESLTELRILNLSGTQVTDAGMEHINGLTSLKTLDLAGPTITDAGLKHVQRLSTLQVLWLDSTNVTDAGLEHLNRLTGLQELDLNSTKVTDSGVRRLQKSLPNCKISH